MVKHAVFNEIFIYTLCTSKHPSHPLQSPQPISFFFLNLALSSKSQQKNSNLFSRLFPSADKRPSYHPLPFPIVVLRRVLFLVRKKKTRESPSFAAKGSSQKWSSDTCFGGVGKCEWLPNGEFPSSRRATLR